MFTHSDCSHIQYLSSEVDEWHECPYKALVDVLVSLQPWPSHETSDRPAQPFTTRLCKFMLTDRILNEVIYNAIVETKQNVNNEKATVRSLFHDDCCIFWRCENLYEMHWPRKFIHFFICLWSWVQIFKSLSGLPVAQIVGNQECRNWKENFKINSMQWFRISQVGAPTPRVWMPNKFFGQSFKKNA